MKTAQQIISIIVLLGVAFLLYTFGKVNREEQSPANQNNGTTGVDEEWVTYTNETYGFEIMHPADWQVSASQGVTETAINIYKPTATQTPPFIHHDDVVNVSIFPEGVPTEGVFGQTASTSISFNEPLNTAYDYVLNNGDRWATYANFATTTENWRPWGFVWARASINNLNETCVVGSTTVPIERCPVLDNPQAMIIREGEVNEEERAIQERMLESFRFLP